MKISLIIPCFNVQNFIVSCYRSCLEGGVDDFEIIFVDDFSEDQTAQEISKLCDIDSRVKIVKQSFNSGTFNARREGFLRSTGDFVLFLDPDDQLEVGALVKILEKKYDLLLFGVRYIPNKIWKRKIKISKKEDHLEIIKNIFFKSSIIPKGNPGKAYSRSLVEKIYGLIGSIEKRFVYAEDAVFFYAAIFLSKDIIIIEDKLYLYYDNSLSITRSNSVEKCDMRLEQIAFAIEKIREIKFNRVNEFMILCRESFIKSLIYDYINICCSKALIQKDFESFKFYSYEKMKHKFFWRDLIKFVYARVYFY